VTRTPKLTFNHVAATLCLALTLMIVGFQSVTMASSLGHGTQPDHAHDAIEAVLLVAEVEHSDHHMDDADDDHDADGPVGGTHHHHADGVGSFVITWSDVAYSATASTVHLAKAGDAIQNGWTPDGIERPPRTLTTRI
jgi:hypothetical protein